VQQFPSVDNLCDQIGIGLCSLDSKEVNSSHCRHWQVAAKKKNLIKWKIWGSRWLLACGGNIYCHNCRYCGYGASEYEDHLQWYSNNSPEALKSERIAMGVTSGSHFQSYIFSTLQSSLGTMYPSILYPYYV